MADYVPPLGDIRFALRELAGLEAVCALPHFAECGAELVDAVLEEAGRFAAGVLAPLDRAGDRHGAWLDNGVVHTAPGWPEAYRAFTAAGWNGLAFDPEHGGQGLPLLVNAVVQEMWHAANMSFGLCPMLTQGAAEAIARHGSVAQKQRYLPKLVSGEWAGTMCLTEPQAGSDLAAIRSRAVPDGGHFRITGQKIFITYGDHDLTANIVHLVLARLPDAPEGVKGISLFLVPKFLPDDSSERGARNDVRCVSLEHKLGIHGSPTAVLAFGDAGGAVGWLVGEANRGLDCMFSMMNMARLSVALEGLGVAERAFQRALAHARGRVQGCPPGAAPGERVPIIRHPDIRRMMMDMKSRILAMRAVAYRCAAALDHAQHHPDAAERARQLALAELLTPVAKGWGTEWGVRIASTALQVHGGMGYVEETGAAQHYRDARITTIYEGTTGIQAMDLVGRKLLRDRGAAIGEEIRSLHALCETLGGIPDSPFPMLAERLLHATSALEAAVAWVLDVAKSDPVLPLAAATPLLELVGTVLGGAGVLNGAVRARGTPAGAAHSEAARFYAANILPQADALLQAIQAGSPAVAALTDEVF